MKTYVFGTGGGASAAGEGSSAELTAEQEELMSRDYTVIEPLNDEHLSLSDEIGAKIGRDFQGTSLHYVTGLARDGNGKLWVSSYYQKQNRLTDDYQLDMTPPISYQAPASGDGIAYLQDMSVSKDGLLLAVSYGHHCAKIYHEDGTLISTIGIPASAGHINAGKLYNPHSAIKLDNGNIAISSYNGYGENSNTHGTITEWDISTETATLVRTIMEAGTADHLSTVGLNVVYRPMRIIQDKDDTSIMWVSEYGRSRVLKVDIVTGNVIDIISKPSDVSSISNSYGLAQMHDGTIVIASNTSRQIIGIDPITKSTKFIINPSNYGSGLSFRGVFEVKPNIIAWADNGSHMIYMASVSDALIEYNQPIIPDGFEINDENLPIELDQSSWTLKVHYRDIKKTAKPFGILMRKI